MEPIGRKLNPEEQSVLTVLTQEGRNDDDRTVRAVAISLERDVVDVGGVLTRLEQDGLVSRASGPAGDECWIATL